MQGGKHQVSRNGGANGDLCCLIVTDLTDKDDIGVVTKDGTKCC